MAMGVFIAGWGPCSAFLASRATPQPELADLMEKGILIKLPGGGRSTSYDLDWEKI